MSKLAVLLAAVALLAAGCGGDDEASEPARGEETVATGQVPFDQAFIDAMVPHHREAIEMAKAANSRGLSQREIAQMLDWREQWFGSRTLGPVLPEVLGLPEGELGMEHGSADEVADAEDVDATFTEMMIPHHEGAIAMAEQAAERGQHEEVKDLAAAIIAAQKREIGIMKKHASGMDHG